MDRIDACFEALRSRKETAFIPYITAGDPTLDATAALVLELEKAGADIIEFGIPFSDPIADGKANQEAALRALVNGVTLHDVVALVKRLREKTQIPILLFTYYNPVLAYGVDALAADARDAGVDGILCVDLPPEEADDYKRCMDAAGIATIFLIAPTSTRERVRLIASQSTGFIYYVSRTGVTGVRQDIESATSGMVDLIRTCSDKPVCVGFGISTAGQAREVAGYADGVIVGSAIVSMVGELGDQPDMPARVGAWVRSLVQGTKGH